MSHHWSFKDDKRQQRLQAMPNRRRETRGFGDLGGQTYRRESAFDRVRGAQVDPTLRPGSGRTREHDQSVVAQVADRLTFRNYP
jgi:hypothetical protein